jgi:hypothetical protein
MHPVQRVAAERFQPVAIWSLEPVGDEPRPLLGSVFSLQDDPASDRSFGFQIPVLAMHDHGQSVLHRRIDRVGCLSEMEAASSLCQVTAFQCLRPAGSQQRALSLWVDPWVIPAQVSKLVIQILDPRFVLVETGCVLHRPLMQRRQLTGMARQLSLMMAQHPLHRRDLAYAGVLRAGYYSCGQFARINEDGPIIVDDAHEALVPPEQFEEAQKLLANRKQKHERCPPGRYLLTGLVTCKHCGCRMHGVKHKKRHYGQVVMHYQCNMNPDLPGYEPDCPHPVVWIERLEQFVLETIRTELLEKGAEQRIREAIIRLTSRDVKATNQDEKKL